MVSAMKQSLKAWLPRLEPLTPVRVLIEQPFEGVKLIAHCREEITPPRVPIAIALPAGSDVMVLIGPEGDFTAEEVELAVANGFISVSLGESRLRTETAALAAVMAAYLQNMKECLVNKK
jgi:16S rRNA (uracil1498-N3)-methyltransferase